jgi:hypothetical protein
MGRRLSQYAMAKARCARCLSLLVACWTIVGCGESGVHVSGEVTFGGKPVPAGRIYFNPDFSKKNDGPQGYADIKDGKFDTRAHGKGACGGATIVVINGFDGNAQPGAATKGDPLFHEYQVAIELPKVSSMQKFDVPASAADSLSKGTRPTRRP